MFPTNETDAKDSSMLGLPEDQRTWPVWLQRQMEVLKSYVEKP